MTEHHIVYFRSPYDCQEMATCTDCDDTMELGAYYDQASYDAVCQNVRLFRTIHAPGKPRFPPLNRGEPTS